MVSDSEWWESVLPNWKWRTQEQKHNWYMLMKKDSLYTQGKKTAKHHITIRFLPRSSSKAHNAVIAKEKLKVREKTERYKKKSTKKLKAIQMRRRLREGVSCPKPKPSPVFRVCLRVLPLCAPNPFSFVSSKTMLMPLCKLHC